MYYFGGQGECSLESESVRTPAQTVFAQVFAAGPSSAIPRTANLP